MKKCILIIMSLCGLWLTSSAQTLSYESNYVSGIDYSSELYNSLKVYRDDLLNGPKPSFKAFINNPILYLADRSRDSIRWRETKAKEIDDYLDSFFIFTDNSVLLRCKSKDSFKDLVSYDITNAITNISEIQENGETITLLEISSGSGLNYKTTLAFIQLGNNLVLKDAVCGSWLTESRQKVDKN